MNDQEVIASAREIKKKEAEDAADKLLAAEISDRRKPRRKRITALRDALAAEPRKNQVKGEDIIVTWTTAEATELLVPVDALPSRFQRFEADLAAINAALKRKDPQALFVAKLVRKPYVVINMDKSGD